MSSYFHRYEYMHGFVSFAIRNPASGVWFSLFCAIPIPSAGFPSLLECYFVFCSRAMAYEFPEMLFWRDISRLD